MLFPCPIASLEFLPDVELTSNELFWLGDADVFKKERVFVEAVTVIEEVLVRAASVVIIWVVTVAGSLLSDDEVTFAVFELTTTVAVVGDVTEILYSPISDVIVEPMAAVVSPCKDEL